MDQHDFHFVAILGSLRRGSYTRVIAATLDELAPDDVAIEVLDTFGELPHFNQDDEAGGAPKSVLDLAAAISRADAVIIVTPEYNHSVPGTLKNALDWISRVPSKPFKGKPVAMQTASPGLLGGARCQDHLRQIMSSLDAVVLNKPEIIVTQVAAKIDAQAGLLRDEDTRLRIAKQLLLLSELAHRQSTTTALT